MDELTSLRSAFNATQVWVDAAPVNGIRFTHSDRNCDQATNGLAECHSLEDIGQVACFNCVDIATPKAGMLNVPSNERPNFNGVVAEDTHKERATTDLVNIPVKGQATRSQIEAWLGSVDRKFTPEDCEASADLTYFAGQYVRAYWTAENPAPNTFLLNMSNALGKWGKLTPGQAKGVLNWWKGSVRNVEAKSAPEVAGLDLSGMPTGLYADPQPSDSRLKVKINNVTKGNWIGWVFVNDGAEYGMGTKLGAQKPGQLYKGKVAEVLARIVANPAEAMRAYGKLTGTCGNCGRHLEDATSVEYGIGPICRGKLGW